MKYPFEIKENDIEQVDIGWFREEFKHCTDSGFIVLIEDILKNNNWEFVEDTDYGGVWKKDFTIIYTTTVYATIGYKEEHLDGSHKYGLQWLECEYEYKDQAHSKMDMCDMYNAMRIALENLLAKGIPFHPESDTARQKDYWHLTHQEQKRNIDLLNATRLLEFNYLALKKLFKNNLVEMREYAERERENYWIMEFVVKDENKNGCTNNREGNH